MRQRIALTVLLVAVFLDWVSLDPAQYTKSVIFTGLFLSDSKEIITDYISTPNLAAVLL